MANQVQAGTAAVSLSHFLRDARELVRTAQGASHQAFRAPALLDDQFEFHREEYRQLRKETMCLLARVEKPAPLISLIVSATVYVVAPHRRSDQKRPNSMPCASSSHAKPLWGWCVPPVFVVLAALLAASSDWYVFEWALSSAGGANTAVRTQLCLPVLLGQWIAPAVSTRISSD
jgi:hypothetical protein